MAREVPELAGFDPQVLRSKWLEIIQTGGHDDPGHYYLTMSWLCVCPCVRVCAHARVCVRARVCAHGQRRPRTRTHVHARLIRSGALKRMKRG